MTTGRVRLVEVTPLGSVLTADVTAGATSLTVEFSADFDDTGGTLDLNGVRYVYTAVDPDTDVITLAVPLEEAASAEDPVLVVDDGLVAMARTAHVALDDPDAPDTVTAEVPTALQPLLPEGIRSDVGEPVRLTVDEDGYVVAGVGPRQPILDNELRVSQATDADGSTGVAGGINEFGDVTGRELSYTSRFDASADTLYVDGTTLTDLLKLFSRGTGPGYASRTPAVTGIGTNEYALLQMDFYLSEARSISIQLDWNLTNFNNASARFNAITRLESSATAPVTAAATSPQLQTFQLFGPPSTSQQQQYQRIIQADLAAGFHSLRFSVRMVNAGNTCETTGAVIVRLSDNGPVYAGENLAYKPPNPGTLESGGADGGSTAPPEKKTYTKTYNSTGSRWYKGSGDQWASGDNEFCYVGNSSATNTGNRKAAFWFNDQAIRDDLQGATVTKVKVYVFVFDGGNDNTMVLGAHGDSTPRTTWAAITGKNPDLVRSGNWHQGSGRWVEMNNGLDDWRTGAKRGVLLGPAPNSNDAFALGVYGVPRPLRVKLEITYKR